MVFRDQTEEVNAVQQGILTLVIGLFNIQILRHWGHYLGISSESFSASDYKALVITAGASSVNSKE